MSFLPWFPFYVNDFWADEAVMCMNNRQVGIYLRLLSLQWREGSIPDDLNKLAALCGESALEFSSQWDPVAGCFENGARHLEGRLVNPRLETIRADREAAHEAMSRGGMKGGKSKRTNKKQKRKPPSSHPEASKRENKNPPISPPQGGGQVADAGKDQNTDPLTAEDVGARWNAEAPKGGRKAVTRLSAKEVNQYLDRLAAFPNFWQIIALELGRLNDLTRCKQWLTFRWLIKSDDNCGRFADGEYSDGSKVTDERAQLAVIGNKARTAKEKAQRERVEAVTLANWPVGTRVKIIAAPEAYQAAIGTVGQVKGVDLKRVVIRLDEQLAIFKQYTVQVLTFDSDELQREGAENGAA